MICISIAQKLRRLALVDMMNAARQCDLMEVQIDRFDQAPNVAELLTYKPKPIILSCRRPQDGGHWQGTEEERLALLRQCIINKADYVEIELDVADQIRKLPPCKRIISYTNLKQTPADIDEIYAQALTKNPDVIKLVTVVRTPEEAWPLLQILSKPAVPTVVVGVGKSGMMLTVLGRKIGAPWTYAALEKGMETYPDQPSVRELKEVYHCEAIDKRTPLFAVTGFSEREYAFTGALNNGFAQLGLSARCLPIQVGSVRPFRKVMDVVKLQGVVIDSSHQRELLEVVSELEPMARQARSVDLLLNEQKTWHGYNLLWRAAGAALEGVLRENYPVENPIRDRMVMVVGANAEAEMVALDLRERRAIPFIASRDKAGAQRVAEAAGCRHIPLEALYSTRHEILVVCQDERTKPDEPNVHPGYLKPGITVMDLTSIPHKSTLIQQAEQRGCHVVDPRKILLAQIILLLRMISDKPIDSERLLAVLNDLVQEEERVS